MHEQEKSDFNKKDRSTVFSKLIFTAQSEYSIFLTKAILVLNSGALVSILVALSRSDNIAIANVLIEASTYFGWGLTLALVGVILYTPYFNKFEEIRVNFEGKSIIAIFEVIWTFLILLSVGIFIFGVWDIISGLNETLTERCTGL